MRIGRRTLTKYLETPAQKPTRRDRASKLDSFKAATAELLQQDQSANAPVIAQRLCPLGYDGGITVIRDYLRAVRKTSVARRAFVRMEPAPASAAMFDWDHFDVIVYNDAPRKL